MGKLSGLEPKAVFEFFEELTKIPRASFKEQRVSDYIRDWAKGLGYEVVQDAMFNLIIYKPGNPNNDLEPVIIQGHLDMVCEKNNDTDFDFDTMPLDIYIDGDYIKARGTTLGADNGVAVAYAMALLADKNLVHPPLEILLTTVEEAGMNGAHAVEPKLLKGSRLINIDSEDEGTFLSSCAGGAKVRVTLDIEQGAAHGEGYRLTVSGLKGGHSGMDIDKGRGNANKLLARALRAIDGLSLAYIEGGSKDNAIPREAYADFYAESPQEAFDIVAAKLKAEHQHTDGGLSLTLERADVKNKPMSRACTDKLLALLSLLPYGVDTMSGALAGLVETSNNVGVVKQHEGEVVVTCAVRSSINSRREDMNHRIKLIAELCGAKCDVLSEYPGWAYNPVSPLRESFVETYRELYGKEAQVLAIHAGVECGIFVDKLSGLDTISFGPNMHDVHTPDERLSIQSTRNCWEFLLEVLKRL